MSGNPWIRFFPSDWLAGTRGMTAGETGVYITLISLMYERGGEIENNTGRLSRLCGTSNASFSRALNVLICDNKIGESNGILTNQRVTDELSVTLKKSATARESANRRWGKKHNKNNTSACANAMQTQCDGNANQKPEAKEKDKPKKVYPKRGSRLPDGFRPKPEIWQQMAVELGVTAEHLEAEHLKFTDYWIAQPGQRGAKLDWDATWRNWMRNARQIGGTDSRAPPESDLMAAARRNVERATG